MQQTDIMRAEPPAGAVAGDEVVLSARDITVAFGKHVVLDKLSLEIRRREILGFVGASGSGKSVLLRTILGLTKKQSGTIRLFGVDIDKASETERMRLDMRVGVLFQHGALFSALTVQENIQVPMREYLDLPKPLMDELALLKVELVGLPPDAALKYPSELSGGMIKRAALARALSLDPELVFLDEPTSGLDPIVRREFIETVIGAYQSGDAARRTVFVSTHLISEFEGLIDEFTIIEEGRELLTMAADEARDRFKKIRARFAQPPAKLDLPGALSVKQTGRELEILANGNSEELVVRLQSLKPEDLQMESLSLEEIFVAAKTLVPSKP